MSLWVAGALQILKWNSLMVTDVAVSYYASVAAVDFQSFDSVFRVGGAVLSVEDVLTVGAFCTREFDYTYSEVAVVVEIVEDNKVPLHSAKEHDGEEETSCEWRCIHQCFPS